MPKTGLSVIVVAIWIEVWSVPAFSQSPPQSDVLLLDKVQLSVEGKRRSVLFRFSRPPDSINSFALSSPSRLVIDVNGPVQDMPSGTYRAEDALLLVGFRNPFFLFSDGLCKNSSLHLEAT